MGVARRGPRGRRKHNPIAWDYSARLLDIRLAHAGLCLCPATPPTLSPARPGAASAFVAIAAAGSGRPAPIRPLHPSPPPAARSRKLIWDAPLADDSDMIEAMFLLMERVKAVVEPAGAAGLAHLLTEGRRPAKRPLRSWPGAASTRACSAGSSAGALPRRAPLNAFMLPPDRPGVFKSPSMTPRRRAPPLRGCPRQARPLHGRGAGRGDA